MIGRLLAAVVLLTGAVTAQAYELLRVNRNPCARDRQNLFWPRSTVNVSVTPLSDPYAGLAIEAWQRWNLSLGRFQFGAGSGAACTRDGVTALAIGDTPCGQAGFGDALAITRSRWNDQGVLVDADVTFKSDTFVLEDDSIFRQVAMHELGHVLGLDHSDACGRSGAGTLMKAVLSERLEAPQADDIEGAEFIYRQDPDGGDGTVPEGVNSCAIVPPRRGGAALPWAAMPLLLLWRRLRRHD